MTAKPSHVLEIFLQPGEFYFGDESTRIRTLLGSCISITLWHPRRCIGGMCHYMLPSRGGNRAVAPDGRYADEVIALFLREIALARTHPEDYEVKLFGGGNMFPQHTEKWKKSRQAAGLAHGGCESISLRNIEAGRSLMERYGFRIKTENTGGDGRRHVIFDIWSGHVWVRRGKETDSA